jgi:hypothetical protein
MATATINVKIKLKRYIAHPYWPELAQAIDIQKQSGVNRVRSEDKRESALLNYLKKIGMSKEEYQALIEKSKRQWYRVDSNDPNTHIIVPAHQLSGMLVQAASSAPAGARVDPGELRSIIDISDFVTIKAKADGVFSRYIMPKDGTGKPLSNQRQLQSNEYLENVEATGTFVIDTERVKPESVKALLEHAIVRTGVGAARKMGYGRGGVVSFEVRK